MDKRLLAELEWLAWERDVPLDKVVEDYNRTNTHLRDTGTNSLVKIYTADTPGQTFNKVNIIKKLAKEKNAKLNRSNKSNYEPQLG